MENLATFISKKINAKPVVITAEEHEDGIGACVGQNYFVNGEYWTEAEAAEEAGVEVKISTGKLQAKSEADAKAQAMKIAEQSGVKAIDIKVSRFGSSNNYNIRTRYVK